ncbi:MAG TPA: hypothetical protein VII06_18555 [Chloroflexota bacterium]
MALTLIQAAQLTTEMLLRGVIETVIEDSPVLQVLPFESVEGNSLKYNMEVSPGAAQFYAVGSTWTEGTATFRPRTSALAILGGDADVDNFLDRTMSDRTGQRRQARRRHGPPLCRAGR